MVRLTFRKTGDIKPRLRSQTVTFQILNIKKRKKKRILLAIWRAFWDDKGDVNKLWDMMYDIIVDRVDYHSPMVRMFVNDSCPYW